MISNRYDSFFLFVHNFEFLYFFFQWNSNVVFQFIQVTLLSPSNILLLVFIIFVFRLLSFFLFKVLIFHSLSNFHCFLLLIFFFLPPLSVYRPFFFFTSFLSSLTFYSNSHSLFLLCYSCLKF